MASFMNTSKAHLVSVLKNAGWLFDCQRTIFVHELLAHFSVHELVALIT